MPTEHSPAPLIAATRPLSLDGADEIEDELVPEGTEDEGLN